MAILQGQHTWLGEWTGRHQEMGVDGQTPMGLMGVDRKHWGNGEFQTLWLRGQTVDRVTTMGKKTWAVSGGDEEGQTDTGVKETDRLIVLGMDRHRGHGHGGRAFGGQVQQGAWFQLSCVWPKPHLFQ